MAMAHALYDFTPANEQEVTLKANDVVKVLSQDPSGWWEGEVNGKTGLFPSNYVQLDAPGGGGAPPPAQTAPVPQQPAPVKAAMPAPKLADGPALLTGYGAWASMQAQYVGCLYAACGVVLIAWGIQHATNPPFQDVIDEIGYSTQDWIIGAVAMITGSGIAYWEKTHGDLRTKQFPRRSLVYLACIIPGYLSIPTRIPAGLMTFPIVLNWIAFCKGESFTPRPKRKAKKPDPIPIGKLIFEKIGGKNPEGRVGRIVCVVLWFTSTVFVGVAAFLDAQNNIAEEVAARKVTWTVWVPVAKFFGHVMDLNFTVLLLPVSRTIIRWCYNNSTGDQTCTSKTLRIVLYLLPLDQALKFHRLCAWTGFFSAVLHAVAHLLNYYWRAKLVWQTFGWGIWITGCSLLLIMLLLFSATHRNVKGKHFELFWGTHMLFPVFLACNVFHGKGMFGPNYWKWLLFPGAVFVFERCYREYSSRRPVSLCTVSFMTNNVVSLRVGKMGPFEKPYKEGQYAYIACPGISEMQWHPFTISSAPQEETVSFHIRVQGKGSWTQRLQEYMRRMCKPGVPVNSFYRMNQKGEKVLGKIYGPDGKQMLRIYGPHSAPTQHLTEYDEVILCTSGIGVTPLAAAMKSIVLFRWKYYSGKCYPDRATFVWITSHKEIASFRWFIRTIREVDDAVHDALIKTPDVMNGDNPKMFKVHMFITSFKPEAKREVTYPTVTGDPVADEQNDVSFWGTSTHQQTVDRETAPYSERDLYDLLMDPSVNGGTNTLGHVTVHNGRPDWNPIFTDVAESGSASTDIGVTFCGNPFIGESLTHACLDYSRKYKGKKKFRLHKEVF